MAAKFYLHKWKVNQARKVNQAKTSKLQELMLISGLHRCFVSKIFCCSITGFNILNSPLGAGVKVTNSLLTGEIPTPVIPDLFSAQTIGWIFLPTYVISECPLVYRHLQCTSPAHASSLWQIHLLVTLCVYSSQLLHVSYEGALAPAASPIL